jgi:two-component system OmpR family response regulator
MVARSPRRHTAGMETASKAAAPLRVFVVEDSALIRERLEAMIVQAGAVSAGHAAGVDAAIQAILAQRPDLVILDIQLVDGTGFDVLRALHDRAPDIDIYLLSNHAAYPYRQLAERLGARGFFDKSKEFGRMRDVVVQRAAALHH